jgi:hypothetical protein
VAQRLPGKTMMVWVKSLTRTPVRVLSAFRWDRPRSWFSPALYLTMYGQIVMRRFGRTLAHSADTRQDRVRLGCWTHVGCVRDEKGWRVYVSSI